MKTEYILEAGTGRMNEDSLILNGNIFGVFDGATSLNKARFEHGKTGGLIASATAGEVFAKNCQPLYKLAQNANSAILNRMIFNGVDVKAKENLWSTSAAVIRIKENMLEWVQTGDAFIILILQDDSHKVLVRQEDHDYETMCMWKSIAQENPEKAEKKGIYRLLENQIKRIRSEMNNNYGVLNGEKQAIDYLNLGIEPLDNVREILLFTDGLSIPGDTPQKSKEFTNLVQNYHSLGLKGLKDMIRNMEKDDPFCIKYPRFKCHDDIAAISISLD